MANMNKRSFLSLNLASGQGELPFRVVTIRKVNSDDSEEMRRISLIDKSAAVLKEMVGGELNDGELVNFVKDSQKKTLVVVSGLHLVSKEEVGKLQGWILVYTGQEVRKRAEQALKRKFGEKELPVLEVSYAKFPDAPGGQMACGLRQVLVAMARKEGVDLRREKFNYQRLVTAYVDPQNFRSRHILEASGFLLQPRRVFWSLKKGERKDLVYILDWQRLGQKVYGPEAKRLFFKNFR